MKRLYLFALVMAGAAVLGLAGVRPPVAQAAGSVTLYSAINYSGSTLNIATSVPNLQTYGFYHQAGSIASTEQVPVSVYSSINYGGTCQVVPTTGIADLSHSVVGIFNIASVKIGAVCPGEIVFYRDAHYQGPLYEDTGNQAIADFKTIGMNDAVSSIAVAPGVTGAVYRDANPDPDYSGGFYDYSGKGWGGNVCQPVIKNRATLVGSVVGNDSISGYLPGWECRLVILFANKDFGGTTTSRRS